MIWKDDVPKLGTGFTISFKCFNERLMTSPQQPQAPLPDDPNLISYAFVTARRDLVVVKRAVTMEQLARLGSSGRGAQGCQGGCHKSLVEAFVGCYELRPQLRHIFLPNHFCSIDIELYLKQNVKKQIQWKFKELNLNKVCFEFCSQN